MSAPDNDHALRIALVVIGLIFLLGLYPLTVLWPDGFMWEPRQAEYEQMIILTLAVLGIFLLRAAMEPSQHKSLISFAAWSSLAHGGVMLVQALRDSSERANLFGDVPALLLAGGVLLFLNRVKQAPKPETEAVT